MSTGKDSGSATKHVKRHTNHSSPTPETPLAKLVESVKHFISNTPKQSLYIGIAVIVAIAGVTTYTLANPTRSEAKFCSTLHTGMDGIWGRYNDSSDKGSLTQMGVLMNNMSEFSKLLRDLNKVAPSEIEDDMKVVSEAWDKSIDDGAKNGATAVTNPLGALSNGLAGGIVSAIKNGASYKAVDEYASSHCGRTLFGTTGSNTTADTTTTSNDTGVINIDTIEKSDFKPWEGNQKGIVIKTVDSFILIDPETKTATSKLKLPDATGRTPGGDTGRSYAISTGFASSISPNLRYIIAAFEPADQYSSREMAYYDLKEQTIKGTGIKPKRELKAHNGLTPHGNLIFKETGLLEFDDRDINSKGVSIYYDIANSKVVEGAAYNTSLGSVSDVVVYDYKNKKELAIHGGYHDEVQLRYKNKLEGTFPCWYVVGLIDRTKLLCEEKTGMKVLDITNVVDKKAEKDDPDSYDYKVGRLHYDISDIATIDMGSELNSYALSPDLKKVAIVMKGVDSSSLYIADLASGESTKVGTFESDSISSIEVLRWL